MKILELRDLHAKIEGSKDILNGIDLVVNAGETHTLMGPNGSGKSTLARLLAGDEEILITHGSLEFMGESLTSLDSSQRARAGLFLAFQYPVELPGVTTSSFLREIANTRRTHQNKPSFNALEFVKHLRALAKKLDIADDMLKRGVNEAFSGGEKKRLEILQMSLMEPILAVLDETDSGLDVDAIRQMAQCISEMQQNPERAFLIITHYARFLDHVRPDFVHILSQGRIVHTGDAKLADEIERNGYDQLISAA